VAEAAAEISGQNARWRRFERSVLTRLPVPRPIGKLLLGLVVAAGVALLAVAVLFVLDAAVDAGRPIGLAVAALAFGAATFVVVKTRFYEFWVPWRRDARVFSDVYGSVLLAWASLTVAAVSLEVVLGIAGLANAVWVQPEGESPRTDPALPGNDDLVAVSVEYFVWSFLDGIPVLKLTESLGWEVGRTFDDYWSGVLLVLYKLGVILPVVALIVRSLRPPEPETSPQASR
jgi:hypothetical protein